MTKKIKQTKELYTQFDMHAPFEFNLILRMEFSSERPHFTQFAFDLTAMRTTITTVRVFSAQRFQFMVYALCGLRRILYCVNENPC